MTCRHATDCFRNRSGFTLIEMVAVIILITTVLAMSSMLLQSLLRIERGGRHALEDSTTVSRLVQQFRNDAHRAVGLSVEADDADVVTSLTFDLPDGRQAEYRVRDGRLNLRRVALAAAEPDDVEADNPVPFEETYRLLDRGAPRLEHLERDGRTIAVLVIPGDPDVSYREVRVESIVGQAHRFQAEGGTP